MNSSAKRRKHTSIPKSCWPIHELDAVMIATGDHQHARILAEVVRAGKDCYCEKPMANTIEDACSRATPSASKQVVQMGSQWLSDPYQHKVRDIVRSGKLGKIVSINQSWNFNGPRWRVPNDKDIAAIREQDTDWNRWLLGRRFAPFDPRAYFEFRILQRFLRRYHGPVVQPRLESCAFLPGHLHSGRDGRERRHSSLARRSRESGYPYSACPRSRRSRCSIPTAPLSGTHTATTPLFAARRERFILPGGEGSPQWWFLPEDGSAWRSNVVVKPQSGKAKPEPVTIPGHPEPPPVEQNDDLKYHTDDWFRCMRTRKTRMGTSTPDFAHAIAVIMATRSYREGKKMYWDRKSEQISYDAPA